MADINWKTRQLRNRKLLLWGELQMLCGHTIKDRAQVRDDVRGVNQGKVALEKLIKDQAEKHAKECK